MKTTSLNNLADFVITYCNVNGISITPLKLQKVLYYIQAWHIVKFEKEQLFNELPEAWVNGPVYRSVYNTFKTSYRNQPIFRTPANADVESILNEEKKVLDLETEQLQFINTILKFYAPQSEEKLVLMTHHDSPWNEAREGLEPFQRCNEVITVDSMYRFYILKTKKKD